MLCKVTHCVRRQYQSHQLHWVDWEMGHVLVRYVLVYLAHRTACILYHNKYEYTVTVVLQ